MRKVFLSFVLLLATDSVFAQVTVAEPEFINSYNILTSDSTFAALPKENGEIKNHENKTRKWTRLIGGAADLVGVGGVLGAATAGSTTGIINGIRVASAAGGVANAAGTVSGLAGKSGLDIVFDGAHSAYEIKKDQDVRLLIKGEKNETDPMDTYRIVRFVSSKKDRRIQWIEFESSLIGTKETEKAGYVQFTGHKYGEQSYLLTIPASEVKKGEYGIVFMAIATAAAIPVGTFSVK